MQVALFAGEASGDLHGALLAREILARSPGARLWGTGGAKMRDAGVEIVRGIDELAVLGFVEVIARLPFFMRLFGELKGLIAQRRPDAVVLIDYPGLNLRLAKAAHEMTIPVAYYVSPQVWAWGEKRVEAIKRCVDRMIVILPFEEAYYAARGVSADFVGHPLVGVATARVSREEARREFVTDPSAKLVGLLPGSRPQELRAHLPLFLKAIERARAQGVGVEAVLARAPTLPQPLVDELLAGCANPPRVTAETYSVLAAADLVLVASGTATLEAALFETPMIVVYKTSAISYAIGKRLVRVPHIALANLVAGERVVPELIQDAATQESIAGEMVALLRDDSRRAVMRETLAGVRAKLGEPGAAARAAEIVASLASSRARV
ncbi:MAG: lipid-A-disaccharide synthase [bacterium]